MWTQSEKVEKKSGAARTKAGSKGLEGGTEGIQILDAKLGSVWALSVMGLTDI